jgi:hypothetical protein
MMLTGDQAMDKVVILGLAIRLILLGVVIVNFQEASIIPIRETLISQNTG